MNDFVLSDRLEALAAMSQKYGGNPDFVLAGEMCIRDRYYTYAFCDQCNDG